MRSTLTWLGAALALIVAWSGAGGALMAPAGAATRPAPAGWSDQNVPLPPHAKFAGPGAVSCLSASDCVLVGSYSKPGVYGFLLAERWNGQAWTNERIPSLPGGGADLNGVSCVAAGRCLAVGGTFGRAGNGMLSARLEGSTWTTQTAFGLPAGASGGSLSAVWCASMSDCTAVGEYSLKATGAGHPLAEHWDGHSWTPVPVSDPDHSTNSYLNSISCSSAGHCLTAGYYNTDGTQGLGKPVTAQWDGHSWSLLSTPIPAAATNGATLSAISCPSAADCTAVGGYWSKQPEEGYTLAERWDGSAWTIQAAPDPSTGADELNDVSCVSATNCTAVGFADGRAHSYYERALAEHWNGKAWFVQPTAQPTADEFLTAVACRSGGGCTAVGGYRRHQIFQVPLAQHN